MGVAAGEGDVVGVPVGCGVFVGCGADVGETEWAGVVREVGPGVITCVGVGALTDGDLMGTGLTELAGCSVGVTPTVGAVWGLNST